MDQDSLDDINSLNFYLISHDADQKNMGYAPVLQELCTDDRHHNTSVGHSSHEHLLQSTCELQITTTSNSLPPSAWINMQFTKHTATSSFSFCQISTRWISIRRISILTIHSPNPDPIPNHIPNPLLTSNWNSASWNSAKWKDPLQLPDKLNLQENY